MIIIWCHHWKNVTSFVHDPYCRWAGILFSMPLPEPFPDRNYKKNVRPKTVPVHLSDFWQCEFSYKIFLTSSASSEMSDFVGLRTFFLTRDPRRDRPCQKNNLPNFQSDYSGAYAQTNTKLTTTITTVTLSTFHFISNRNFCPNWIYYQNVEISAPL